MNSTKELRAFLVGQMDAAARGELDDARTKGVANLAQQIYNTMNIELKKATLIAKYGDLKIEPVQFDD